MPKKSKKQLEAILGTQKVTAAVLLVERELAPTEDTMKLEEIAEEVGVKRNALYKWRTRNPDFIEYVAIISAEFFRANITTVYKRHMQLIDAAQPSTKAIELWYKTQGMLTDKTVIEDNTSSNKSNADIKDEIKELDDLLKSDNEGEAE